MVRDDNLEISFQSIVTTDKKEKLTDIVEEMLKKEISKQKHARDIEHTICSFLANRAAQILWTGASPQRWINRSISKCDRDDLDGHTS